jgi:hypothetical protein
VLSSAGGGAVVPQSGLVEVDVRLEMSDLFPALSSISFRRFGWIFIPILLVPTFLLFAKLLIPSNEIPMDPITLAIPFVCFLLFFLVLPYLSARSTLKTSKLLQGTVHYTFSENGIDTTAQGAFGHNDWSNLRKVIETKHVLLFYPSKGIFYVIPKRFFSCAANLDSMRELIRTHVTGKIKLRPH